jgi:hypothetical protein
MTQTFSQKPGEFLDDYFAGFESIASSLSSSGPLAYTNNECVNNCCMLLMIMCGV